MNEITRKVKIKTELLRIMEDITATLDFKEKDIREEYVQLDGEVEEYTDWKTGELKIRDKWGNRPKAELSEDDRLKLEAVDTIRKALEKLI